MKWTFSHHYSKLTDLTFFVAMALLSRFLQCKVSTNLWIDQSFWWFQQIKFFTLYCAEPVKPESGQFPTTQMKVKLIVCNCQSTTVLVENLVYKTILRINKNTWKLNLKCLVNFVAVVAVENSSVKWWKLALGIEQHFLIGWNKKRGI